LTVPRSAPSRSLLFVAIVVSPARAWAADAPTTVTITGDRADALKDAGSSRTTIGREEIEHAQPENSSEILRRVPGIQVRQEDPMGLRLNIGVRGLSPVRSRLVLVEEDGVPVVVSPYGEPELYYMPAVERLQRLDVLKGSDVLRYGPQTVGAVIKLTTWEPTEQPSWLVAGSVGSRSYREALARYADTYKDVGYVVQAFHKEGDGYRGMAFQMTDAMAKAHFETGPHGELKAKIAFHDQLAETTYTGLTDLLYRQDRRQDTIAPDDRFGLRRYEASLRHEQRLSDAALLRTTLFAYQMDLALRFQDFDRNRRPQFDHVKIADPTGLFFRKTTSLRDRAYEVAGVSTEIEAKAKTGELRHRVIAGVRAMADTARRTLSRGEFSRAESGDLVTDDTTRVYGVSGWIEDQVAFTDALVLTPAFRLEHSESQKTIHRIADDTRAPHDVDLTGSSSATGAMPGLGLVVGKPRLAVFSSLYLGYSAPRVAQAITPDGRDADLHAERSSNYEVGVRGRAGKWLRGEADVFWINFDNQLVSNNPLSGASSEFVNGGRTRHLGAELTGLVHAGAALDLPLQLDLGAHYTYVSSRFVGGTFAGNAIPYSPANTGQVTLDAAHPSGLGGHVALSYVGAQFTDEQNTIEGGPTGLDGRIDPYTVLDVGARYRHAPTGLGLSLAAKNVMDKVYISDRLPNGIFTGGFRQIFLTLSWSSPVP
jgi:Fe(3+) dicitrate transport protein